jgi:hypothetical protein
VSAYDLPASIGSRRADRDRERHPVPRLIASPTRNWIHRPVACLPLIEPVATPYVPIGRGPTAAICSTAKLWGMPLHSARLPSAIQCITRRVP